MLGGPRAGFAAAPGGVRAVRAAGAGASAAAADGGAIAAAVAATGRGAAVGDRGRGCRRRSGWVRPGLGRAEPPLFGWLPGLCVGPSGREQRRRPRPGRGDAPVRPGVRGGAGHGDGHLDGPDSRAAPGCRDKGAPRPGNAPRPFFPPPAAGGVLVAGSFKAVSVSLSAPLPVTGRESVLFPPQVRPSFFVVSWRSEHKLF